MVLELEKVHR